MIRSQRGSRGPIAAVVVIWLVCAGVPATVFAGQKPTSQDTDSVQSQDGPGAQGEPTYDRAAEATFIGAVEDVQRSGAGRLRWLMRVHTFGLGHSGPAESELVLRTDADTLLVHLGPTAFLNDRNVRIEKGDRLAVTGSRAIFGGPEVVLAREIRKDDAVWTLRDASGRPLWNQAEPDGRRFWMTTKVVLVVVAAKVALLATVLRH